MVSKTIVAFLGGVCLIVILGQSGCKRQEAIYSTDKDLGSDETNARALLPTSVTLAENSELLATVSDPDLSHLKKPEVPIEEAAGALPADDIVAIKAILPDMLGRLADSKWAAAPMFFIPEQEEQLAKFVPTIGPLFDKLIAVSQTLTEVGGDQLKQQLGPQATMDPQQALAMLQPLLALAKVTPVDAEHANLTLGSPLGLGGGVSLEIPFTKHDDDWKIEIPDFPAPQLLDQLNSTLKETSSGVIQTLDDIAVRLEDGSLPPQAAVAELTQALLPVQQALMGVMAGPAPPPMASEPDAQPEGEQAQEDSDEDEAEDEPEE
jgi:hypothetical protein